MKEEESLSKLRGGDGDSLSLYSGTEVEPEQSRNSTLTKVSNVISQVLGFSVIKDRSKKWIALLKAYGIRNGIRVLVPHMIFNLLAPALTPATNPQIAVTILAGSMSIGMIIGVVGVSVLGWGTITGFNSLSMIL